MSQYFSIHSASISDRSDVTALLRRSYPQLLPDDYDARLLRDALPLITTAQPALLACGTYFVARCPESGVIVGAGGWTDLSPARGIYGPGQGHVRHVATDPDWLRRGVAAALIAHTLASARAMGMTRMHCMSTLTARPFYAAMGFRPVGEIELTLAPGVYFPAVQMVRDLEDLQDVDECYGAVTPDAVE
ncbi:GNAT family N-acetyltransferase [Shimia aestuarii]|uniref:Acetyltransferase (GNAT) family protein n=1 Tax=Shimia aestuarii TaxID=254406 RepID=A0A1I4IFA1_9RHOB|nr:GNAT family N-acetyltransferase [Shimia aestuarii]SFL53039.1 Acetyltransferase (GNAT) family protein [Shimia aestuarii]